MKTYTHYSDPSHGWIAVTQDDLQSVGININMLSPYSYQYGTTIYLEEDCDAGLFLSALEAAGVQFKVVNKHTNKHHMIRNFPHLDVEQRDMRQWQSNMNKLSDIISLRQSNKNDEAKALMDQFISNNTAG